MIFDTRNRRLLGAIAAVSIQFWRVGLRRSPPINHGLLLAGFVGLTIAMSGCSGARRTLGLELPPPDEFQVVTNAPLVVPPDIALRPPVLGAANPSQDPRQQARVAIFGLAGEVKPTAAGNVAPGQTRGEAAFLSEAGVVAGKAPADIRALVDRESLALVQLDSKLVDRLIFWQPTIPPGTVVNAPAEAKRLKDNAAAGKPVTAGDTPVIERRRQAIFEGLF